MPIYDPKKKKFEDENTGLRQGNMSTNTYDPSSRKFNEIKFNENKKEENNSWFRAGAFDDGYQFGDVAKTILGTGADVVHRAVKGVAKVGEGIGDLAGYGAAQVVEWMGNKSYADQMREAANENVIDKLFAPVEENILDKNSVLGRHSQNIGETIGQIGAYAATGGLGKGVGTATMFTSAAGSAGNEAYSKEGVTNEQAWTKILAGGAIATATERLFGIFGKSGLDTAVANKISSKLSSGAAKTFARLGIQATAEATEEFLEYAGNQLLDMGIDAASNGEGAKFYENWNWEEVGEQMASAAIASGIVGAAQVAYGVHNTEGSNTKEKVENYAKQQDVANGVKSDNEKKVIDLIVQDRIDEAEKNGEQVSKKKIKESVEKDLEKGYIDLEDIERSLGGDTYTQYEEAQQKQEDIQKQIDKYKKMIDNEITVEQREEYNKLKEELSNQTKTVENLGKQLRGYVNELTQNDALIRNSYNEYANKGNAFNVDLSQVKESQRDTYQRAIDSGVLNDTNRSHDFVDLLAKLEEEKGVKFDFINNEKLKDSSLAVDGKQVNGYVNGDTITLNMDSNKALNSVVGHEITHILEGTELYEELKNSIKEYATSRGEYEAKLEDLRELYKEVKDADIEKELTADFVGDYLFTDEEFVRRLSTQNRNLFQKIYDEIKYLSKLLTSGSKEGRQLEKIKHTFEKAYRNTQSNVSQDTQYSITGIKSIEKAIKNNELGKEQQELLNKIKANYDIALSKEGKMDNEDIRKKYGWFKDKNGDWKFEITDAYSKLKIKPEKNGTYKLEDLLDHKLLYDINPKLKNMTVKFKNLSNLNGVYYDFLPIRHITLSNNLINRGQDAIKSTLLHEIQHYSQMRNDFERGSMTGTSMQDMIDYVNSLGEIESTNVQQRMNLTQKELKDIAPESSKENPKHANESALLKKRIKELENKKAKEYNKTKRGRGNFDEEIVPYLQKDQNKNNDIFQRNGIELDNSSFSNTKYSISVSEANTGKSNSGTKLSKEQQEYFADSKATDENGNLITVYHTTTDPVTQFNEFDPTGTEYYRFGEQVVNYYTDNKNMSGSYADQKYYMADTKKINSIEEAKKWLDDNKFKGAVNYDYELTKTGDDYRLKVYHYENGYKVIDNTYSKENLLKNLQEVVNSKFGMNQRIQYEGYVNITNPYVVDAEKRNWNQVVSQSNEFIDELDERIPQDIKNNLTRLYRESENKSAELREEFNVLENAIRGMWNSAVDEDIKKVNEVVKRVGFNEIEDAINYDGKMGVMGVNGWYNIAEVLEQQGIIGESTAKLIIDDFKLPDNIKEYIQENYNKEIPLQMLWTNNASKLMEQLGKNTTLKNLYNTNQQKYLEFDKYRMPNSYFLEQISSEGNDYLGNDLNDMFETRAEIYSPEQVGEEIAQAASVGFSKPELIRLWGTSKTTNDIVKEVIASNQDGTTNYDGVIIKNVYDYGGHSDDKSANDLYVTFNSNQFKAVDNTTPTKDPDIRYSLSKDAIKGLSKITGESYSMLEANLGNDEYSVKNYLINHTNLVKNYMNNNNITVDPVMKPTELDKYSQEYKDFITNNNISVMKLGTNKELLNKYFDIVRNDMLNKGTPENIINAVMESQRESFDKVDENYDIPLSLRRYDKEFDLIKNNIQEIEDEYETEKKIKKEVVESDKFQKYLDKIVKPLFEKEYHTTEEIMEEAENNHGITDNYETGAYMTTNGNLLDFNDGGYRDDHRTIDVFDLDMNEFIEAGAIRMKPEANGFEMSVEPTQEQYSKLYDYIDYCKKYNANRGSIDVDIDIPGTMNYDTAVYNIDTPTNKIINDIKTYYETGKFPKKSTYADFHYSLSKQNEDIAPIGNYQIKGKDIKLQDIAPIETPQQQEINPNDVYAQFGKSIRNENIGEPTNIAPVQETPQQESTYSFEQANRDNFAENMVIAAENRRNAKQQEKEEAIKNKQMSVDTNKRAGIKESFNKAWRTWQYLTTNSNTEIDHLAKETNNSRIKHTGDMLNNFMAEAQNDISNYQTDNYGRKIGKSVQELFTKPKEQGLENAFNDYLLHYSNIDRHSQGKGSKIPSAVSESLVKAYESEYPQFKTWAKDVWQFGRNALDNMYEAGLIGEEQKNILSKVYPHYVPFFENRDLSNYINSSGEIKTRSTIKKARGNATQENLLPVEEALAKYAYSQKKSVRQNNLYKEIVNTLVDARENIDANFDFDRATLDNLYADDSGNYLTAFINGNPVSVRINQDLYAGLKNDMANNIKNLEERFSIITKPLQKASEINRNILTSWSPTFPVTNAIKDIQDALINSKDVKGLLKNYPSAIKELAQNNTELVRQFEALYGAGNIMGDYEIDTTKGKNKKFLKRISRINEIIELAPRYAEFKASLEKGLSLDEAMYNAREVTTNFGRGGVITKAMNRNGFRFLNASVQGFSKFIRNFSGENGAKGVVSSLAKATAFGIAPAIFNELAFGGGDDKDEEYDALPDYIKDNYYLIKTGDGTFVRIPKGRALSVFGSAARRTLELAEGEEDAFEGYLDNVNSQIGFNNPEENNIFSPLMQAFGSENGEAWYGGDLVPTRLQSKPQAEQYDETTDEFSKWLGGMLNVSPYKINYALDQYSGGLGDIALPLMTKEATSESDNPLGTALAPIKDKFVVDSTTDNKYVSKFYDTNEKVKINANSAFATDKDLLQQKFMSSVSSELAELYKQKREVQNDESLSRSERYKKSQEIKNQINDVAKTGLSVMDDITTEKNYATVSDRSFYKNNNGEWKSVNQDELNDIESMGMTNKERSDYFAAKNSISTITDKYKKLLSGKSEDDDNSEVYNAKKKEIAKVVKNSNLTNQEKAYLYDKYYGDTTTLNALVDIGVDMNKYIDFDSQLFEADKYANGKTVTNSKRNKVFDYINSMDIPYEQKLILAKLKYSSFDEGNYDIIEYLNNSKMSYADEVKFLKKLGFEVSNDGTIRW